MYRMLIVVSMSALMTSSVNAGGRTPVSGPLMQKSATPVQLRGNALPRPQMDGNLSDFSDLLELIDATSPGAASVNQVDNWADGPAPGEDGFQDEPLDNEATPNLRFMHSPINVGDISVVYVPDSDGVIDPPSEDDSWLAVGINIANGDGDVFSDEVKLLTAPDLPQHIMVPFDADGDGDPCSIGLGASSRWHPAQPVPLFSEGLDSIMLHLFTCAESIGDAAMPADFTITLYQHHQSPVEIDSDSLALDTIETFPRIGATCAEIAARGRDDVLFADGLGNDDIEILINRIDSQVAIRFLDADAKTIRHRLGNMVVATTSSAMGDQSHDDRVFALLNRIEPHIETRTLIREAGTPFQDWNPMIDVTDGTYVEVQVEIENTGDVALDVTLTDWLNFGDGLSAEFVPGTFHATMYPQGAEQGIAVTPPVAAGLGLNPIFFTLSASGFINGAFGGQPRRLGVLRPIETCEPDAQSGDRLTIQFIVYLEFTSEHCGDPENRSRMTNRVSVNGAVPNDVEALGAHDRFGRIDSERELSSQTEDNIARAMVSCDQ